MAISESSIQVLRDSIQDGSFPDDNELLTADLDSDATPSLLIAVSKGRDRLRDGIRDISRGQAGDVDEWISQAKKLQEDIARCKIEARQIVEEHERIETTRRSVRGAKNKVQLLEAEISFTRSLEHEMQSIGEISQILDEVGNHLLAQDPVSSVEKLGSIKTTILGISTGQPRDLLLQLEDELCQKSRSQLQQAVESRWILNQNNLRVSLEVMKDATSMEFNANPAALEFDKILDALAHLDALHDATAIILRKLEAFILPLLPSKSSRQVSSIEMKQEKLTIELTNDIPDPVIVLSAIKIFVEFIDSHLPRPVRGDVMRNLLPKVVSLLIPNHLNSAIPQELEDLRVIEDLQKFVLNLAALLSQHSWPGAVELRNWVRDIPRLWLTQRQVRSLDSVRRAFTLAHGSTREVDRTERQVVSKQEAADVIGQESGDDWNAAWDEEPSTVQSRDANIKDEDDTSGWDLEIEDQQPDPIRTNNENVSEAEDENDSAEAWGWGDDAPTDIKRNAQVNESHQANGQSRSPPQQQEVVLTETYTITDIPDYILKVIGKDIFDSDTLRSDPKTYFSADTPLEAGLQSSPVLVLAMFRATAPTHYSHSTNLSNMHLYNDTLYMVQKLQETPGSATPITIMPAIGAMTKFARQTYTRELDIQRTILSDLLDGAQGFQSCSESPYNRECKNAINGVIDRVLQVHQEWKDILGRSHLMQSVGSLITMIMHKIIRDIEDMEDITEAQGRQLVEFCHSISSLESLFSVKPSSSTISDESFTSSMEASVSTIALYVSNYFRFQYLTQILESNLVDINYLWKEGELHLEFSAEEVVDLIKALFSESNKRREAIYEIKKLDAERHR